jgi:hypothetical protein
MWYGMVAQPYTSLRLFEPETACLVLLPLSLLSELPPHPATRKNNEQASTGAATR